MFIVFGEKRTLITVYAYLIGKNTTGTVIYHVSGRDGILCNNDKNIVKNVPYIALKEYLYDTIKSIEKLEYWKLCKFKLKICYLCKKHEDFPMYLLGSKINEIQKL